MDSIIIKYDGDFPNLCSGKLVVIINGKEWHFPTCCLRSGGSVLIDDDWNEHVEEGEWSIKEWPRNFPNTMKSAVVDAVNSEIPLGCCGGCV